MAILTNGVANGSTASSVAKPAPLDASKVQITFADELKPLVAPKDLVFGQTKTDHMMVVSYDPISGWSTPEICPYAPLPIDPMSSCLQYATSVFEGMKAYIGSDGKVRLFRPDLNMARMRRSSDRVALPPFEQGELLNLIKKLVQVESRWIPKQTGCSLYIRPTIIGTRAALGVAASDSALLYVVCSPTGPYFPQPPNQDPSKFVFRPISLLAMSEHVRAWPGGTGGYKLALNYAPGFMPQREAKAGGYEQVLWLLNDGDGQGEKITEVGAMNFFVVLKRADGDMDVITPPLDGTILPGVTRSSVLSLLHAHGSSTTLDHVSNSTRIHPQERTLTMTELFSLYEQGMLLEAFGVGTAVIVCPIAKIGYKTAAGEDKTIQEIVLPAYEGGLGPVGRSLWERITNIQEGGVEWEGWSVLCEDN